MACHMQRDTAKHPAFQSGVAMARHNNQVNRIGSRLVENGLRWIAINHVCNNLYSCQIASAGDFLQIGLSLSMLPSNDIRHVHDGWPSREIGRLIKRVNDTEQRKR